MTLERIADGDDPLLDALAEMSDELHPAEHCDLAVTIEWRDDEGRWFMEHGAAEMFFQCEPDAVSARVMFEAWMRVQPHRRMPW